MTTVGVLVALASLLILPAGWLIASGLRDLRKDRDEEAARVIEGVAEILRTSVPEEVAPTLVLVGRHGSDVAAEQRAYEGRHRAPVGMTAWEQREFERIRRALMEPTAEWDISELLAEAVAA